jgi:hypothetical protein
MPYALRLARREPGIAWSQYQAQPRGGSRDVRPNLDIGRCKAFKRIPHEHVPRLPPVDGSFDWLPPLAPGCEPIQNAEQIDCLSTAGGKWTVSTEHPVQLGAVPGYAVTLTSPISATLPDGGYEQDQCFVASQRMYHLIAVGPNTADEQRDATRFLGSFQLL